MRISLLISVLALALVGLFSPKTTFDPSLILIGGGYTVQSGETRTGDAIFILARVNVDGGGAVAGNIRMIGGSLNVAGRVSGNIDVYGGEFSLETPSAQVGGAVNTVYSLQGLPVFPSILLVIS